MKRGKSKAYLKALRKKYRLGEFRNNVTNSKRKRERRGRKKRHVFRDSLQALGL